MPFLNTSEMSPSPPHDLSGVTLPAARIVLHWEMPIKYSGTILSFNVYYRIIGNSQKYKKVSFTTNIV